MLIAYTLYKAECNYNSIRFVNIKITQENANHA